MLFPWTKRFDPSRDEEAIRGYIDTILKERLKVDPGTPATVQACSAAGPCAVRQVDFGRGRVYRVCFYPAGKKEALASEAVSLAHSLGKRQAPAQKIVMADRAPQTRRKFGFEVTAAKHIAARPSHEPWSSEDLKALADLLLRIHGLTSETAGKPWRPVNRNADCLANVEGRWEKALRLTQQAVGRRVNPVREAPFREKAFGRLEGVESYELVHGGELATTFARPEGGGLLVVHYHEFHFGYRETDLVAAEQTLARRQPQDAEAFASYYLAKAPEAARRRHKVLCPFFVSLYCLEQAVRVAGLSDNPDSGAQEARSPEASPGEASREAVQEFWDKFLEASGLPEK
jgi:hypothetical protein